MSSSNYDFPVELTPIVSEPYGTVIPNRLAVMRTDSKEHLAVVSNRYRILPHVEVVEGFREALVDTPYEEEIQVIDNGAVMFITCQLLGEQLEVRGGDIVSMQISIINSYDGNSALRIVLGGFRAECSNGLWGWGSDNNWYRQRHIDSEVTALDVDALRKRIAFSVKQFTRMLPVLQAMSVTIMPASQTSIEKFFDPKKVVRGRTIRAMPRYLVRAAMARYQEEGDETVWGFYNALTAAITHNLPQENPQKTLAYGKIAWDMANKALKGASKEKKILDPKTKKKLQKLIVEALQEERDLQNQ